MNPRRQIEIPFPIRDFIVVLRIPAEGLTTREAKRLAAFVQTLDTEPPYLTPTEESDRVE